MLPSTIRPLKPPNAVAELRQLQGRRVWLTNDLRHSAWFPGNLVRAQHLIAGRPSFASSTPSIDTLLVVCRIDCGVFGHILFTSCSDLLFLVQGRCSLRGQCLQAPFALQTSFSRGGYDEALRPNLVSAAIRAPAFRPFTNSRQKRRTWSSSAEVLRDMSPRSKLVKLV